VNLMPLAGKPEHLLLVRDHAYTFFYKRVLQQTLEIELPGPERRHSVNYLAQHKTA